MQGRNASLLAALFGGALVFSSLAPAMGAELTVCAEGQGAIDPLRTDMRELSDTVCRLLDDWYVERDALAFRLYLHPESPLRDEPEAFSGAFTVPPERIDPQNLDISAKPVSSGLDERPEMIMNPGNERFFIIEIAPSDLAAADGEPEPEDEEYEDLQKLKTLIGTNPLYIVLYYVQGDGYNDEGMAMLWVRDHDAWRLFGLHGFD